MLNTKNCVETAAVYLAIFLLLAVTLWMVTGWPSPLTMVASFLASDTAREIERYQVLLGMVGAAGLLGLAYLDSARRRRRQEQFYRDQSARGMAHGLALEAEDVADACDSHAARLCRIASGADLPDAELLKLQETEKELALVESLSLLTLDQKSLAKLGRNGHAGVNQIRQGFRQLDQAVTALGDGGSSAAAVSGDARELASAYARVALSARANQTLFETLYRCGTKTADERTLAEPVTARDVAQHLRMLSDTSGVARSGAIPIRAAG